MLHVNMNTPVCAMPAMLRHAGQSLASYDVIPCGDSPAWHHSPVQSQVKQEPLDQDHHSPINDSGISPGHGSSSDPSPGSQSSHISPRTTPPAPGNLSPNHPTDLSPNLDAIQPRNNVSPRCIDQNLIPSTVNGISRINSPNPVVNVPSRNPYNPYNVPNGSPHYAVNSPAMGVTPQGRLNAPISPVELGIGSPMGRGEGPRRILLTTPTAQEEGHSSSSSDAEGYYNAKMAAVPESLGGGDPLRGLQMALERTGMLGTAKEGEGEPVIQVLQCPLCTFVANSRPSFNAHLGTHYEHKCTMCDFTAQGVDVLRAHLRDSHDQLLSPDTDVDANDAEGSLEGDEPGVRVPRVNSQGKVKTFRCKQCEYVTVTKLDFWEHSRGHIKAEKLLICPKCPFVTEYKHHLEYHLRNHFGSKPFKCDKCSYSCVNKSMLNSHLKSHSNVYQYRCSDCNYATKYCHSLKLHLRKYEHKPAMVLNADGSPNPLPIIDVYGTRRGPKLKPKEDDAPPTMVPNQYAMFQTPFVMHQNQMLPFPYGPMNPMMNPYHNNASFPAFPHHQIPEKNLEEANMERIMSFVNNNINNNATEGLKDYMTKVINTEMTRENNDEEVKDKEEKEISAGAPLDLSKADDVPVSSAPAGNKNRRKGKAFKLERLAMLTQHNSEDEDETYPARKVSKVDEGYDNVMIPRSVNIPAEIKIVAEQKVAGETEKEVENIEVVKDEVAAEVYNCTYCDITFRDIVMYTMHMGYHGYQDPFKCNMCGQLTADKVSFFLHVARTSHC